MPRLVQDKLLANNLSGVCAQCSGWDCPGQGGTCSWLLLAQAKLLPTRV